MKTIAIIGAGPAGLTVAYEILTHSSEYEVKVFEKESLVGGLSKTYCFSGNRVDIGGHRFFSKQPYINKIWNEVLPEKEGGMLNRRRVSHVFYEGKMYEYPIQLSMPTIRKLGVFDALFIIASYLKAKMKKRKINSLEDFYINQFGEKLYQMFFKQYTYKLWGIPAKDLSPNWGAQRVQGVSILAMLKNAFPCFKRNNSCRSFSCQFKYPSYGSGQFWDELAKKVLKLGGEILLGAEVTAIYGSESRVERLTYRKNNRICNVNSDIIISSLPLRDLIFMLNNTSSVIRNIAKGLHYRDMIIVALEISKKNLGEALCKYNNDCWVYVQDPDIGFGRIQLLNNWSSKMSGSNENFVLELEYYCFESERLWKMTDEKIIKEAFRDLIEHKFLIGEVKPINYMVKRIPKAYPIYIDQYCELNTVKEWINNLDNLYCIGRNGQHHYNNMDHSMMTGIVTASIILGKKSNKEDIWSVNNDQEYIER
ncbi:NAD(P)-binding protein [Sporofaciens sp. SGI.106]|uniref:NAD(P)-binding protein n=1 Tax=Sporofaciens sp. SGI.106 TaxID=3420568 RepID=UPI003CFF9F90